MANQRIRSNFIHKKSVSFCVRFGSIRSAERTRGRPIFVGFTDTEAMIRQIYTILHSREYNCKLIFSTVRFAASPDDIYYYILIYFISSFAMVFLPALAAPFHAPKCDSKRSEMKMRLWRAQLPHEILTLPPLRGVRDEIS